MKSISIAGSISMVLLGAAAIATATFVPAAPAVVFGLGGGFIGGGLATLARSIYWSTGGRAAHREEHELQSRINLADELKRRLRERSGWITYLITLGVVTVSLLVFSVVGTATTLDLRLILIYLGGLWIFMYVAGIVVFRVLSRRFD